MGAFAARLWYYATMSVVTVLEHAAKQKGPPSVPLNIAQYFSNTTDGSIDAAQDGKSAEALAVLKEAQALDPQNTELKDQVAVITQNLRYSSASSCSGCGLSHKYLGIVHGHV